MLVLYSTSACHLCEQAKLLIKEVFAEQPPSVRPSVQLKVIDIVEDERLMAEYGVHIPVLAQVDSSGGKKAEKKELFWPFDKNKLQAFFIEQ